jgi:ribose transport system substrate-binding protein
MSMKKLIVSLFVVAIMAVGMVMPTFAAEEETYAMVVFLKGSEFFNWAYAGMLDAAKLLGPHVKCELQGPAEWDATMEARAIQQLTARKVDGIIVTAGEANTLQPAIDKAIDQGIPVITFDSDSPTSKRLAFAGTNNYQAGYVAGKTMADWLGGQGAVGISTFKGPDHLDKRVRGFKDALAEFAPDIKTYEVDDEGRIERAGPKITAMLKANPDITGIFASHGNPGSGSAQAVRDLNLQGKVQIMAFDFGGVVVELIEKGEIRGTVGQNPYLMGYYGMLMAYAAKHPTEVRSQNDPLGHTPEVLDTGVRILYKEDMADLRNVPKF